ncbi:methyl-accepting chemotaxis protein [Acinetobacter bereziniae]|uniref:methyl-accepting chemotaxis protein n=1 Tax=Acinetobacter bereziniae TaxID=106648 RepID=UPI00300B74A7
MKFFKYLIFILLSFFSINVFAVFYEYRGLNSVTTGDWMSTPELACKNFIAKWAPSAPYVRSSETECVYRTTDGDRGAQLEKRESSTCPSTVTSMPISVPGWTNWNIDQIDAYSSKIQGKTACYKGCKYKNPTMTGSEGSDSMSLLYGDPVKDASCPNTETRPDTPYPDNVTPPQDGCKNGEAYCDKPTTGCPSGYTSGSFNGKQICVKNSTDPTKPNPNDPNNGGGKGEGSCNGTNNCNTTNFDDSKIINAINNAVSSITNSLNTINESITTVANAVNATTNAVNNNTSAVNAVKSSVDALHNTINAVTTAVNNNTSAVTSAVHSNTTATNAVKASVDALNSTVSAVTTAVDNNTKAVNANGDKVANAVKDNITATNAVKTAVENLNSAVNAVSDAVNANGKNTVDSINANGKNTVDAINTNGKNTVDAVNKGTEATKENGKKLDGINDSVKEGNGFLKDIKDWLTQTPPNGEDAQIPKKELEKKSFNENLLSISAPNCPPDWRFNWVTPFGTIDKTVSYQDLCDSSGWLGYLFLAFSYVIGARIVMGDS